MKRYLKHLYQLFCMLLFDPRELINKWRGLPYYFHNLKRYRKLNQNSSFNFLWRDALYTSFDRFDSAGTARNHYFWQDIWAARYLYLNEIELHVDLGSRLDGFIAHILPFCHVVYVDYRQLDVRIGGLDFVRGSIIELPFESNSLSSISCLHVLEHIGLGRYGDRVNPDGYIHAAGELSRVLAPGATLLLSTPVGKERLYFDAHRVFDVETILETFSGLNLKQFSLVDDKATGIIPDATIEESRICNFGCGLFIFEK